MSKIRSVTLETVIGVTSTVPEKDRIEVAFAGKSNVGKSSLINTLIQRKSLARTSSQPGKTQTINYYRVNEGTPASDTQLAEPFAPDCYLVDLPGYGFAQAGMKQRQQLKTMIERYCLLREPLVSLFVLIDCRLAPQPIDLEFMQWLGENEVPFSIVFTKTDKLGRMRLAGNIEAYKQKLHETWEELPPVFLTSSEKGIGRDELTDYIEDLNRQISHS